MTQKRNSKRKNWEQQNKSLKNSNSINSDNDAKLYQYEKLHESPYSVFMRKGEYITEKSFCDLDIVRILHKCNIKCKEIIA